MDAKIRETAEKIYVANYVYDIGQIGAGEARYLGLSDDVQMGDEAAKTRLKKQAKNSIEAAKVFHALCKDDMMQVKK